MCPGNSWAPFQLEASQGAKIPFLAGGRSDEFAEPLQQGPGIAKKAGWVGTWVTHEPTRNHRQEG